MIHFSKLVWNIYSICREFTKVANNTNVEKFSSKRVKYTDLLSKLKFYENKEIFVKFPSRKIFIKLVFCNFSADVHVSYESPTFDSCLIVVTLLNERRRGVCRLSRAEEKLVVALLQSRENASTP